MNYVYRDIYILKLFIINIYDNDNETAKNKNKMNLNNVIL